MAVNMRFWKKERPSATASVPGQTDMSDGGITETGGSVGSAGGKTSVVVRVQPWDEAGMREVGLGLQGRKVWGLAARI